MFNLENEISNWKKLLRKSQALEDGYIEELESHLRDEIDKGLSKNLGDEEAFNEAVNKIGSTENFGEEYYKSDTTHISSRPPWQTPSWMPAMMYNYLKVAIRSIKRDFGFSAINITGLAVGITCMMFVIIYVNHLYSFDKYHKDYEHIYRAALNITSNNITTGYAMNVPPLAPALKRDYAQVEEVARIFYWNSRRTIKHEDKLFYEDGVVYADKEIFNILSYKFIYGNPETALSKPLSLVIPAQFSLKTFGTTNSLDKTLNVDGDDFTITGVIEEVPDNSHMPVEIFVSMEDLNNPYWLQAWDWPGMYTYIKLKAGVNPSEFENSIRSVISKNMNAGTADNQHVYEVFLQPITDIFLNSKLEYDLYTTNSQLPFMLIVIGLFILAIASFTYINLSTVRMIKRFKEIGMRKILGASRVQLFLQFMNESFLMISAAALVSVFLIYLFLPLFNELAIGEYEFFSSFSLQNCLIIVSVLLIIVVISGFYPALILSSFSPSKALKNKSMTFRGNKLRRILVIGQFAMSVGLIFGALIAQSQIDYMKNKEIGINKENKIVIPLLGVPNLADNYKTLKSEILKIDGINQASVSWFVPGQAAGSLRTKSLDGANPLELMMYYIFVDSDYLPFYEVKFATGRNFLSDSQKDITESCIINKAAAKALGWIENDAISKKIITGFRNETKTVIGVVENFHYRGLQFLVEPLIIEYDPTAYNTLALSFDKTRTSETLAMVNTFWNKRYPDKPFDYFFLDDYWDELYQEEERTGEILNIFTLLSILVASLGLFGLVSYIAETRKKEIGVRKVLGCSTFGVILFMIKRFLIWIAVANIIAIPVGFWAMNKWLQNFPYRTEIEWWMILLTIVISIGLAIVTVLYQSIKSAIANPVNSLRYE